MKNVLLRSDRLTAYVDPFIGTGGHGHTFPASLPSDDPARPRHPATGSDACCGYHYSDTRIFGFTHTHLSGTGIAGLRRRPVDPHDGEAG